MTPEEFQKFAEEARSLLHYYTGRVNEATYSHWNALLTFNGILIGAFSVLAALDKVSRTVALALLACSVFSSILLIINFVSIGDMYNQLLKKIAEQIQSMLNDDPNKYANRKKESAWRYRRTLVAQLFLILEALILLLPVYFSR